MEDDSPLFGVLSFAMIVANFPLTAFVVFFLWKWFVVPLGVIQIGYAHSLGIAILVSLLTQDFRYTGESGWRAVFVGSLTEFLVLLFTLPVAWCTHLLMG